MPYSYVDLNGHMNNTRYFDLAEDLMPEELRKANIQEISAEFSGEARYGDEITVTSEVKDSTFLLAGAGEKRLFRIGMRYDA